MELLVATTVTLLLVVVLVRVFNGASGNWRHNEAQVDAYREARGALQLMARDLGATLQASYAQAGGGADPASAATNGPAMPTLVLQHYSRYDAAAASDPNGPNNEEVYCLTNISNHGASSLCAVGYFCQWMADPGMFPLGGGSDQRPRAFALMRQSLDSNGTYLRMQTAGATTPLKFIDLYKRSLTSPATVTTPPVAAATPVAAYIWDLRFRIDTDLDDSVNGVRDGNDPGPVDHSSPQRTYHGEWSSGQLYPPRLPQYVEIRFKALSSLVARRLEGNSAIDPSTWADTAVSFTPSAAYKQIIQPNYQQFVLRVPLLNAAPP